MALQWCLKYGVLPREDCNAAVKELEKRKAKMKGGGKGYTSSPSKKSKGQPKKKRRKLKHAAEAAGDAGISMGSVEGIGSVTMM